MPEIDPDNKIISICKEIAQIQPSALATERAMHRVRNELQNHWPGHTRPWTRSIFMKIGIPSAAAAAIALSVIVWFSNYTASPASAAEQFKEVVKANGEYKGWVHVKSTTITPPKDLKTPVTSQPGYQGSPTSIQTHVNTIDGTVASVTEWGPDLYVGLCSPAESTIWGYASKTGLITVRNISPFTEAATIKMARELTVKGLLDSLSERNGKYDIQRREQDSSVRYDVKFSTPQKDGVEGMVMLVDPKDKLIRTVTISIVQGGAITLQATYGPPEIKDIYDLGVPRDAKVVDKLLNADVKAILARLRKQAEQDFGDGLAVLSSYSTKGDGTVDDVFGYVRIFGQRGNDDFSFDYKLAGKTPKFHENSMPARWPSWPRLSPDEAFALLNDGKPVQGTIVAGKNTWRLLYSEHEGYTTQPYYTPGQAASSRWDTILSDSTPASVIWPADNLAFHWYSTNAHLEIVRDEDKHKGLVGLKVLTDYDRPMETMFWIDPKRNDVPVEKIVRWHLKDMKQFDVEDRTEYLEFSQLPNKRWYPTKWKTTSTREGKDSASQYLLQLFPGVKLSDKWFADPITRFKAKDIDSPASQPATSPANER